MTIGTTNTLSPALLAQLNGTSTSGAGSSASTGSSSTANSISAVNYLNLMMTQLQNQDPTQPMDASSVMGQLAQFGVVQGITNLNSSFSTLSSQLVSNQAVQASSLLGRSVLVPSSTATLASAGGGISGAVTVPSSATNVSVQVVNAAGAVVATLPLGSQAPGNASFSWNGTLAGGTVAPAGTYTLRATGTVNGTGEQLQTLLAGQVGSITMNSSGTSGLTLQVAGIGAVPFSSVQQIN
jgi:flagellar basal-body rod modification protein FlgD